MAVHSDVSEASNSTSDSLPRGSRTDSSKHLVGYR